MNTKSLTKLLTTGIVLGLSLLVALAVNPALADPGAAKQNSKQLSELSADFWEYVLSIPASGNPILDPTGALCGVGQGDETWFLEGTFGTGTATRSCSIPEGKSLYFPVVNFVNVNTPNVCGQVGSLSVKQLRQGAKQAIDIITDFSAEVDGHPVKKITRVASDVFAAWLPADNIFGCPANIYSPGIDDGYYVLLKPLPVGPHTIHFRAVIPISPPFTIDVTYNLTVVEVATK